MKPLNDVLVIISNDKIGRKFVNLLINEIPVRIVLYEGRDFKRLSKILFKKKSMSIFVLINMLLAEFARKNYKIPNFEKIHSNVDILNIVEKYNIKKVYLFRVGLVINNKLLSSGVEFLNTHCARIPEYGGLGQIYRIYKEKAYNQVATLHRVIEKIDGGEIIATEPYLLSSDMSFKECEDNAYAAGMRLLTKYLKRL